LDAWLKLVAGDEPVDLPRPASEYLAEVGSALRRTENTGDLSAERAALALRRVLSLRVRRVSTRGLLPIAWDLRRDLTIGNGLYVALARPLNVALLSADDRLSRFPALGVRVIT